MNYILHSNLYKQLRVQIKDRMPLMTAQKTDCYFLSTKIDESNILKKKKKKIDESNLFVLPSNKKMSKKLVFLLFFKVPFFRKMSWIMLQGDLINLYSTH